MTCRQTSCRHCGLDIEGFSPYRAGEWRDRGNNTHCPDNSGRAHAGSLLSSRVHAPFIEHATRRESERAAVAECVRGREQDLIPAIERKRAAVVAHTPGPWDVMGRFTIIGQGYVVAICDRGTEIPHEANARLIAAAPDLLDFAQMVSDWLICPDVSETTRTELRTCAKRVIAKAEGEGLQVPEK